MGYTGCGKIRIEFFLSGFIFSFGVCRCLRGSCGDALDRVTFVDVNRLVPASRFKLTAFQAVSFQHHFFFAMLRLKNQPRMKFQTQQQLMQRRGAKREALRSASAANATFSRNPTHRLSAGGRLAAQQFPQRPEPTVF
ncbi:MAG: hypothetical protein ACYCPO_14225 [Acidobacteriaceae bacterium]